MATGLSPAVGTRWFREHGGMRPFTFTLLSGRYLSFTEREEIAILHGQRYGVRAIAGKIGRAPSTVSRELRRNAATRAGTSSIERRTHSGTPTDAAAARRCPSWRRTTCCAPMCRNAWRV